MKQLLFCATILASSWAQVAAGEPLAQIVSPAPGSRFRVGETVPVTINVGGTSSPSWRLVLDSGEPSPMELASGVGELREAEVAGFEAQLAWVGKPQRLTLSVAEANMEAEGSTSFKVVDGAFALIPLQQGNFATQGYGYDVYSVNGAGSQVLYSSAENDPAPMTILHRDTGVRQVVTIHLGATDGVKLSGDGNRLFYKGRFGSSSWGLGFLDLADGSGTLLDDIARTLFSVDTAGDRIVFQHAAPWGDGVTYQYELADLSSSDRWKITTDPAAIVDTAAHLNVSGSTPLISADGSTVVFLSEATLGIDSPDPNIGCRVFAYDATTQTLRQAAALPSSWIRIAAPALSGDGRWLSFTGRETSAIWPVAILIDVQSGEITAPAVDVGDHVVFDALVTRDGNGLILSTTADLDARADNADHNLELFYYDRSSGNFSQMSDTLGGIGRSAGGCSSYRPTVSDAGDVAVFAFQKFSGDGCGLDGPQRNAMDGLSFGFTRALRKRVGNSEVVLEHVAAQRVVAGQTLQLEFAATDPDGDPISFFAQLKGGLDVPTGSVITDHYDGTAAFEWRTRPADAGDHVLTVAAFDEGGGEMFQDVVISIVPAAPDCVGACRGGGEVAIDDLVTMINIALGLAPLGQCNAGDADRNGTITVDEILVGVENTLNGCGVIT